MQTSEGSARSDRAPLWVRLGTGVLAVPQLVTGLWAVLDARHWYRNFPGFDPRLLSADGPFNAHLATDAGAGFLATGVVLAAAAMWGRRSGLVLALVTYLIFAGAHLVFHSANPADGLTSAENARNVVTLAIGAAFPFLLLWGARAPRGGAAR